MDLFPTRLRVAVLLTLAVSAMGGPPDSPLPGKSLGDESLEELMNVEVTSVSRKEQKLSKTAAAIFVITQRGHPAVGGDDDSGSAAHGSGPGRGANQHELVGGVGAGVQRQIRQ
ncbi:MAG: hypothetical protein ABI165_13990 [Bryobacteraceae bacterium]